MEFQVPINKGSGFSIEFFNLISDCVNQLGSQTGKWPDQIVFTGVLGDELMHLIESSGWNMERFQLTRQNSILDRMKVGYSKELDQISTVGIDGKPASDFSSESLADRKISGLPGPDTINRINAHVLSSTFRMEKKIRPEIEVKLVR